MRTTAPRLCLAAGTILIVAFGVPAASSFGGDPGPPVEVRWTVWEPGLRCKETNEGGCWCSVNGTPNSLEAYCGIQRQRGYCYGQDSAYACRESGGPVACSGTKNICDPTPQPVPSGQTACSSNCQPTEETCATADSICQEGAI